MAMLPLFPDEEPVESAGFPALNSLYQGDALDVLRTFDADSIDLIVTSPPYADQRKKRMVASRRMSMLSGFCPSRLNSSES